MMNNILKYNGAASRGAGLRNMIAGAMVFGLGLLCVPDATGQALKLSLQECREMALTHSEEIQQADNSLSQAGLDRKIAKAAYMPNIEGSAMGTYVLPDMDVSGSELRMRGTYLAGISLTQPIYAGGKIVAGKKLSAIGEEAAQEQLRMTKMDVVVDADNAYWTYIAVCEKVRMMESYQAQMDTLYSQTKAAVEAGMSTEDNLLRVEAKRTEILYQLQKARSGADLCRMSLCNVIGEDADTEIEPVDTDIVISGTAFLSDDISNRPEMLLLEKQVEASQEQIKMTRGDMLPSVGLQLGYDYYGNVKLKGTTTLEDGSTYNYTQEFKDGFGLAMLAVKIPIFHWNESRNKVRKAKYELQNAELEMQRNSRLLSIQTRQAIHNLQDSELLVETAEAGARQADETLRMMQSKYGSSMATLTDLMDAQSQWQQAQSNLIEARTQYKIYETEYLRAVGELEI